MGNAIISNEKLRKAFSQAVESSGIGVSNVFGNVALEAAYDRGEPWLEEMLEYLRGNYRLLAEAIAKRLPELKLCPLEGTYLAWIDFRALGMDDAELARFLTRDAKVWLDEGTKFGNGGSGFMRMNFACPRAYIAEALDRIEKAIAARR
jgi:cystathionine beta-lyase